VRKIGVKKRIQPAQARKTQRGLENLESKQKRGRREENKTGPLTQEGKKLLRGN